MDILTAECERTIRMYRQRCLALLFTLSVSALSGCGHTGSPSGPPVRSPGSASADASPGLFRDVAQEAGLNFRWGHGGKTPLTIIETLGHGSAFLDFDQDGLLDILLVGNHRLALYRNTGTKDEGRKTDSTSSVFVDVTRQAGLTAEGDFYGLAVGDYDNDGYPDVYITGYGTCVL